MLAFLAFLPILFCVLAMTVMNWSAKVVMPISWFIACVLAAIFWKLDVTSIAAYSLSGLLNSIDVLVTILGAILVMNTLKASGAMTAINSGFHAVSPDARVQAVIVGFMFVSFLEGAAGFGTPAALAGPLLASLGFPPIAAASVALICDSSAVATGAIGTPTIQATLCLGGEIATPEFVHQLSLWTALPHAIMGVFVPFMALMVMTKVFGREHSFKPALEALPFALFAGLSFSVPYLLVAVFIGPEFPALLGGLIGMVLTLAAAKKGFLVPKTVWRFGEAETWPLEWRASIEPPKATESAMPLWKAWTPYALIALLLVVTRIPALGLKQLLQSDTFTVRVGNIFGVPNTAYTLKWAFLPGTMFVLVAVLAAFFLKMKGGTVKSAWKTTGKQVLSASSAVIFGLTLVQILRFSGSNDVNDPGVKSMIFYMAEALSGVGRILYTAFAPLIGILGAFVSGSNTVSNTLFTNLQYQSAVNLGLAPVFYIAMQNIGGSIGNMICVNNTVAVCATLGATGKEGKIIRLNLLPTVIYTVAVCVFFFLVLGSSLG